MTQRVNNRDLKIAQLYASNVSAPLIAKDLRLPLDFVYRSLKKQSIPRRSLAQANKYRFENSPLSFKFKENLLGNDKDLLIAGLMLYFGEGAKTGVTVDFANSDVRALSTFLNFLRRICRIDEKRLRLYLYCFSDQNPKELIKFWSKNLKVSIASFTKPYIRTIRQGNIDRRMPYGVLHIRYSDKRLLEKILLLSSNVLKQLAI